MASMAESHLMQEIIKLSPPPAWMQDPNIDHTELQMRLIRTGPKLINKIKAREPEEYSDNFKLAATQFVIQYYTMRMFDLAPLPPMMDPANPGAMPPNMPEPQVDLEKLEIFKADQARDMEYAWRLLTSPFRADHIRTNAQLLMIEIGQRLEDSVKLAQAFDQLESAMNEPPSQAHSGFGHAMMKSQMAIVAFTAAPLIGRWDKFIEIGNDLPPQELERFSMVSQSMPVPDYSILYHIAKEEDAANLEQVSPDNLPWQQFYIQSIRVKFRDLDCEDFVEKREELLREINSSEENVTWEEVPNPNTIQLKRMGAIYQCVSFAEAPQQLCGIFRDDRIRVKGKTQAVMGPPDIDPQDIMSGAVNVDPSQLQVLVQEESWDLQRDAENPNKFVGTYEMHNYTPTENDEKVTDPEKAPLHMTFDLEVLLCSQVEHMRALLEADQQTAEKAEVEKIITDFDELELD